MEGVISRALTIIWLLSDLDHVETRQPNMQNNFNHVSSQPRARFRDSSLVSAPLSRDITVNTHNTPVDFHMFGVAVDVSWTI